jgi:hypothetical protein
MFFENFPLTLYNKIIAFFSVEQLQKAFHDTQHRASFAILSIKYTQHINTAITLNFVMLSDYLYSLLAEYSFTECCYAESSYPACNYA